MLFIRVDLKKQIKSKLRVKKHQMLNGFIDFIDGNACHAGKVFWASSLVARRTRNMLMNHNSLLIGTCFYFTCRTKKSYKRNFQSSSNIKSHSPTFNSNIMSFNLIRIILTSLFHGLSKPFSIISRLFIFLLPLRLSSDSESQYLDLHT